MIGDMTPSLDTPLAPVLGLAEAAQRTGKSVSTIRRKKSELLALGAVINTTGWAIPIPALVQLGLLDRVTSPGAGTIPAMTAPVTPGGSSDEIAQLKSKLAAAEQRAELAEALANERTLRIDDLRQSLLMIEAAQGTSLARSKDQEPVQTKRRWWKTS